MNPEAGSSFVYVTYIRTSQERLWSALTDRAITSKYWFGAHLESDWQPGAPWRMVHGGERISDQGTVVESDPPRRLVLAWYHEMKPEARAEGESRCVIELEPFKGAIKLTVTHSIARTGSQLIGAVSGGWPKILSNLKSFMENGELALDAAY